MLAICRGGGCGDLPVLPVVDHELAGNERGDLNGRAELTACEKAEVVVVIDQLDGFIGRAAGSRLNLAGATRRGRWRRVADTVVVSKWWRRCDLAVNPPFEVQVVETDLP